ncbi:unnamed protein product [Rotaria sp. Silwood2]|nr:unnamed protein product [Rotaria sp. Silwood2]CAF2955786.1 unnamed protein product [Rotaria sp. Silwood2]CAF4287570.1 unnamed protein product [Rotaria sp. Silwood2]
MCTHRMFISPAHFKLRASVSEKAFVLLLQNCRLIFASTNFRSINFRRHGFNEGLTKDSSLEQFRSNFNFIALDRLPVPGLDGVPSQWQIYPQTPISSFSEGVTLEQYNSNTQILQLNVQTRFFAIYGNIPQNPPIACAPAPKGTYLQVRRDIQGIIKLKAKLVFNS